VYILTCLGNYYACIKEHQKALEYFNRALKLNHKSASTLIVMGHEYLEISNTHAAIECYRRAIGKYP
jgi:anaphase-promoting complex subunit 8